MMHGTSGESRLTKNDRRDAAREKARQLREQQKKKETRNRVFLQGGIVLGALAIVAVVSLIIFNSVKPAGPGPANMASDGVVIGEGFKAQRTGALQPNEVPIASTARPSGKPVEIRIYHDYLCPFCSKFEQANNDQLKQWLTSGAATVEFHPLALLTSRSAGTKYSLRAANAAACVANSSPDQFYDFNSALFVDQPAEGSAGRTDSELKKIVANSGVLDTSSVNSCIDNGSFKDWVQQASARATAGPLSGTTVPRIDGTPTVLVDGVQYKGSPFDKDEFAAFVTKAAGQSYSTPTPTP